MGTHAAAPLTVRNHRLPLPHFEALCAGVGDADVLEYLWHTQRSRRVLLLNAVVETANALPGALGPLPPAAAAWEALAAAEAVAPAEAASVLLHPQAGSWAAYVLRRCRGGAASAAPLWVDFGTLHAIALLAAARAGLTWRTRLPVRAGRVMLPGLGMATLPGPPRDTYVDAATDTGTLRLHGAGLDVTLPPAAGDDPAGWQSLRRVRVGDEVKLSVWLDDLDPFRDLGDPIPPERLSEAEFDHWHRLLTEAWTLLCRDHRDTAAALAAGVVSLVPLPGGDRSETRSASTGEAFGSVLISPPPDAVALAVALVHEFQHTKLGGLMHLGPLCRRDDQTLYYAPWRDDPRPLTGLLQGIYAFVGIAAFWREHRNTLRPTDRRTTDFEYTYTLHQVDEALRTITATGGLTPWGEQLAQGLASRVRFWLAEPVSPEATVAATLVADAHRAGWRLRCVRPSLADVAALTRAWRDGAAAPSRPYGSVVEPRRDTRWSLGLPTLVRQRLAEPEAALALHDGLTEADAALVRGDAATARAGYRARIVADAGDLNAWTGLGLADDSCSALLDHPGLVQAVYLRLADDGRAPDPADLAAWVSSASSAR